MAPGHGATRGKDCAYQEIIVAITRHGGRWSSKNEKVYMLRGTFVSGRERQRRAKDVQDASNGVRGWLRDVYRRGRSSSRLGVKVGFGEVVR